MEVIIVQFLLSFQRSVMIVKKVKSPQKFEGIVCPLPFIF